MGSGHHLSLSLSGDMWNQMLRTALPFTLADGEFDLAAGARSALAQLQVGERARALLVDRQAPEPLVRFTDRARKAWHDRRDEVWRRIHQLVRVEGSWHLDLDDVGTDLRYGQQKVSADAWLKGVAEGQITFLEENVTVPFRVEKRLGASLGLGRVRYARDREAVIGNVQDLAVHLGDTAVLQLLARVIEYGLERRAESLEPVPILKREQVEGLVGPMGEGLQLAMGVDDLQLDIDGEDMTLKVRFGFSRAPDRKQIRDRGAEA